MSVAATNPFRARREELELTLRELSIRLRVSEYTVFRWEHDRCVPRMSLATELCAVYQIDLQSLKGWIGEQAARVADQRGVA